MNPELPVLPGMHSNRKRVSDETILESYARTGSVHKTAAEVGLNHASVHERLVKLGANTPLNIFTSTDIDRLKREYLIFRDAGRLKDLAMSMGRTKPFICRIARSLGLTDPGRAKPYAATWKYLSEDAARVIFEQFKESSLGAARYCRSKGYDDLGFSRTMQAFFPDEWDLVIEAKAPRQSLYHLGRAFEYRCRDELRRRGYFVLRSPRSGSPVDLVAIAKGRRVLMIQCKRSGQLGVKDWNALLDLAEPVDAIALMADMPATRGIKFYRLTGRKDGSKHAQPMEAFEP